MNELVGAVYDEASGSLSFVGRWNAGIHAPPLRLDDWLVALRLTYAGDSPAVSIDPGPDVTVMNVTYFGAVQDTHLGQVMFESDRLLKRLSMGFDNMSQRVVTSTVPDFQTELALLSPASFQEGAPVWHRMWFESADGEWVDVTVSADRRAVLLDGVGLVVHTEYVTGEGEDAPQGSDPAAEAFVAHFNAHLAEFADEWPVLHELSQCQRFLAVARWLRDTGVPVSQAWLQDYPLDWGDTPATTPRVTVSRQEGLHVYFLEGGVDLTAPNREQAAADRRPDRVAEAVDRLPARDGLSQGDVQLDDVTYHVESVSLAAASPAWRTEPDPGGGTWYLDGDSGLPRVFDDGQTRTNFDCYSPAGLLRQKTVGTGAGRVRFVYSADGRFLVDVIYQDSHTMLDDATGLLTALAPGFQPEGSSSQEVVYQLLTRRNWLRPPAPGLLNRLLALVRSLLSGRGRFIAWQEVDGNLIVQQGPRSRTFYGLTLETLANLLAEQKDLLVDLEWSLDLQRDNPQLAELLKLLDWLGEETGGQNVLSPGQYFADTTGPELVANQELAHNLAIALRLRGYLNFSVDDHLHQAAEALDRQRPIVDGQGAWALEVWVDLASFAASDQAEGQAVVDAAQAADIPVCTMPAGSVGPPALTCTPPHQLASQPNLLFVTGRPDDEVQALLNGLGRAGTLQERYLVLDVCCQDGVRSYVSRFVQEHGAIGVLAYDGRVSLHALRLVVEALIELGESVRQGTPPAELGGRELDANIAHNLAVEMRAEAGDLAPADALTLRHSFDQRTMLPFSRRPVAE
jgi:hypothetical protein